MLKRQCCERAARAEPNIEALGMSLRHSSDRAGFVAVPQDGQFREGGVGCTRTAATRESI